MEAILIMVMSMLILACQAVSCGLPAMLVLKSQRIMVIILHGVRFNLNLFIIGVLTIIVMEGETNLLSIAMTPFMG